MNHAKAKPIKNIPKQKAIPPSDCSFVYPRTIMVMQIPRRKPAKFPIAKSIPVAVPSATGKAISQPSSSIMGTKGIKKNELYADTKLASTKMLVSRRG